MKKIHNPKSTAFAFPIARPTNFTNTTCTPENISSSWVIRKESDQFLSILLGEHFLYVP